MLSMACYQLDKTKTRGCLEEILKAENLDEAYRAGQITNFEAFLKEDDSQISASAFNAAVNYACVQNREKALEYLEVAAKDPHRAAQVDALRKQFTRPLDN